MPWVSHDGRVELDTAELEVLLAAMREPENEALREAIRGRLRDMQKRGFPEASRAGRGKRSVYTLGDIVKVAIALELVDLGLTSSRVIAIVESNADILLQLSVLGWRVTRLYEEKTSTNEYREQVSPILAECVIVPRCTDDAATPCVRAVTPRAAAVLPRSSRWPGRRGRLQLSLHFLVEDLVQVLTSTFRYTAAEVDAAFHDLGAECFGNAEVRNWTLAAISGTDQPMEAST